MQFDGVLFFPVTPFDAWDRVDEDVLAEHIRSGLDHSPGGVFAACGTGEFHALSTDEHATVVNVAVEAAAGRVPVLAGAGGALPMAVEQARRAAEAGADGLLLFPPYLVSAPASGVLRYIEAVTDASDLPVIVYQRGGVRFSSDCAVALSRHPRVVGLKDGLGDLEHLQRLVLAVRGAGDEAFTFFNGMPTAEMSVRAYRGIGVELYSSAAFCFVPEVATAFHRAAGVDHPLTTRLLSEFYAPLVRLRDQVPGYAVSLVKAGVRLRGMDAGGVRPPLVEVTEEHLAELSTIIEAGLSAVRA